LLYKVFFIRIFSQGFAQVPLPETKTFFGTKSFAHRWTVKRNGQASEKVEKFGSKFRRLVNVTLYKIKRFYFRIII